MAWSLPVRSLPKSGQHDGGIKPRIRVKHSDIVVARQNVGPVINMKNELAVPAQPQKSHVFSLSVLGLGPG